MATDDETRPARTKVTRKPEVVVTEVATRKVKAVKRKSDPFAGFSAVTRVSVLRRSGLVNEAGEKDNGWALRDRLDKVDPAWFVMRAEPLLTTLSRLVVNPGHDFDVICGGTRVASLGLRRAPRRSSAQLSSLEGRQLASFRIRGVRSIECTDEAARPILELKEVHPSQANVLVGRRSIATLSRVEEPGMLLSSWGLELSFEEAATSFERLCAASAVVAGEAWMLVSERSRGGTFDADDLFSLFGD